MDDQFSITTHRLLIRPLAVSDASFIIELVNTEGWLTFIGNRNIHTDAEAIAYIQMILESGNVHYWVVTHKENEENMGILTFIKRDSLDHPDIGFAFLPAFTKKGYAWEATHAVLNTLIQEQDLPHILATTFPHNINSILLLKKLGLVFEKEIEDDNGKLHVYGASAKQLNL